MNHRLLVAAVLVVLAVAIGAGQGGSPASADLFKDLQIRSLGPSYTTGRIADIAVDPNNSSVYYVASAAGGLWKSENRGDTFTPVFDTGGAFNLCCVVVDPKNSAIVWLGTGENSNPRSAMYGDGLYKSTDAGKTWTRVGLAASEHLGKIAIDPRNSDVVYVASQGPLWSAGGDRGVFKTTDGGKTWKAVLTVSADTGANDLVIDPNNPDVLYATTWQRRRATGQFVGGGPESGVYRTTNAGGTWTKLSNGLPKGDMGRIAIAVDPKVKPTRVYVLANALRDESGFYRSDDAGATFARTGHMTAGRRGGGGAPGAGAPGAGGRGAGDDWYRGGDPGYYHELFTDQLRPDTIWSVDTNLEWSRDGGKTWAAVPDMAGVHVDFHVVVPDPKDKNHLLVGNDGGMYESWDEGRTWRHFTSLPVTQFYRVAVDQAKPFYHVCGGAQDNGSMCGPSRTLSRAGIRTSEWFTSGGGDGFFAAVDPDDPNYVYASSQDGAITRLDLRTSQTKSIRPRGAGAAPPDDSAPPQPPAGRGGRGGGDRTNWDAPYIISPHSPTRLYWGSNFLYRTDDRGDSWTRISPDLTKNLDPTKIPIMGKVWDPATTVSWNQATTTLSDIVTIDESPLLEGLLYLGTDDGNLQVSEDAGKNWRKVDRFPGVPEGTYISKVHASPRDANVLFVALNNWQRGDYKPYLLKSADRGRTFTSIAGDLPAARTDVWSVVQDHINGDLMFAGTEFGLYFTVDGGTHWTQLKGMPTAQVRDLTIQKREGDLVMATFGRGFFILDDYTPLREATAETLSQEAALLPLRPAYQYDEQTYTRAAWGNTATPNPPMAAFTYVVGPNFSGNLVLAVNDANGRAVCRFALPVTAGVHRQAWDLRVDQPGGGGGRGGRAGGGGAGRAAATPADAAPTATSSVPACAGGNAGGGGFGGRGGGAPVAVEPGRYVATIGRLAGDAVTAIGKPQTFQVMALPK
jgi:photosystem II stability/assembly factor-like uncharacterized protein